VVNKLNRLENYIGMSGIDFRKKLEENDEICVLANALLKESVYSVTDLVNAKEQIRIKFIEEAIRLIKNLEEHSLQIVHSTKMVV